MYESKDQMVSHPTHYQSKSGLEVIDAIEAFTEGLNGIEATDTGNIIKYACRWKKKNGIQDLEKIMWYTQHLIDHLKKTENESVIAIENNPIKFENSDIIFACTDDAVTAKNKMELFIKAKGWVSIADLYNIVGLNDNNRLLHTGYGWSSVTNVNITHVEDGVILNLPMPERINLKGE